MKSKDVLVCLLPQCPALGRHLAVTPVISVLVKVRKLSSLGKEVVDPVEDPVALSDFRSNSDNILEISPLIFSD